MGIAVFENYETIKLRGATRNVEYLGTFVAWLVINRLLDARLERSAGSAVVRVRMQELTGSAFLATVLHGELAASHINEAGRSFVERYFVTGRYRDDFAARRYHGDDEWILYDEMAPRITAAFRKHEATITRRTAKIIRFPGR